MSEIGQSTATTGPAGASAAGGKLLLLDGHSMAYRAFYALPAENFTISTGQSTNAIYGFTSMLINVVRDEAPTHLAVAFDVSRATLKRTTLFPAYKAQRASAPPEFAGQVELLCELLTALHIPVFRKDGSEADDLIATLATQAAADGFDVAIVTGDRDALQLVTDHITVLYPRKGVADLVRFTPEAVEEKYGLTPQQYPDFAALRGDPSDNLPSIPGIGEKTAAKWIREFGSLAQLAERADEVKGKAGEALRAHLEQVQTNRLLTELDRHVELELRPADLARAAADTAAVDQLFTTLEFRALRPRMNDVFGLDAPEPDTSAPRDDEPELHTAVLLTGELAPWLAEHAAGADPIGIAVEGRWGRGAGQLTAIALATADAHAAYFTPDSLDPADEAALGKLLADPAKPKILHDAKGPILAFAEHGFPFAGLGGDTALAAYLVQPGVRTAELADLVRQYLGRELTSAQPEGQLTLDVLGEQDEAPIGLMRAASVLTELSARLEQELDRRAESEQTAENLLRNVELPLLLLLARMERAGIAADREYLSDLEVGFAADVKHAVEEAHSATGVQFNLGSPKQLQEILFEQLKLPKTKKIKTGYTTDADALTWLAGQTDHPLPVILLRHRDVNRLRTTVEGLVKTVLDDGRIHTTFNQMVAATGRLSSVDPNLQNIPVRTEEGRRIRKAFIAGPGYDTLMTADYSQIEMRIMAHLSGDEGLIEAFNSGEDLHSSVAAKVWNVSPREVTGDLRRKVKAVSYGLAYGQSAYGLAQNLGVSNAEATHMMEDYFARFGGIRDYLRAVVDEARKTGYTQTVLGRRRYLPDLTSTNPHLRQMAERMALNAPIQGSAADIIKVAMLRVDDALREHQLKSRLLLQVHDELVLEVCDEERELVEQLVRREMGSAYELRVPLDVSVGFGRDWQAAGH
ncbi:MAG TPA: DNA polymerase I [Actinocrinis sp.]|uniref:DNA polymerase I n=1 Tax=Actinocrinis sp. TaxID=1920516 RepID=UPI002D36147F|nr:DNA polymerase I [Actinocrinis sp.]HZU54403.1 DNA polymerase I [Actinocrinis sp.]